MKKINLFTLLLFCGAMLATGAASAQTVASDTTGSCTWTLTGASPNLTLTISGTGAMGDYRNVNAIPWNSYRSDVKTLSIGQGVTAIGRHAFYGCGGLTAITIPAGVTAIGELAFGYCDGLTFVTIPASVTAIGENPFCGCAGLTSINVDADNTAYVSENGVLFNKSKTALISYPAGKSGSYAIPASVTAIGNGAFLRCYGLTSVTIPASVTAINDYVFFYCHSLTSVTIPASATAIGRWAFAFCSGLTSITIPASVTDISNCAFYGCSGLTSVTNLSLTPQNIGGDVFSEVNTITCTLRVPTSAVAAYKIAEGWRDFRTIQGGALATGVEDQPLAASVSLYPNPFASEVRLTGAAGCTLTVVTAAGAVVHTQKVAGAAETIALGKLPSGAYFFRLEKDGRKTAKIMINV